MSWIEVHPGNTLPLPHCRLFLQQIDNPRLPVAILPRGSAGPTAYDFSKFLSQLEWANLSKASAWPGETLLCHVRCCDPLLPIHGSLHIRRMTKTVPSSH